MDSFKDDLSALASLRRWATRELGLAVPADQPHLFEDRVIAFAASRQMDVRALALRVQTEDGVLVHELIDTLTTNETYWFRDPSMFNSLGAFLQDWPSDRQLSVWSAASSSGQELYSVSMLARDVLPNDALPPVLVGSDLSVSMVSRARSARYSQSEVSRGLPAKMLVRHFTQDGLSWVLNDDIRGSCRFFTQNVVHDPPPGLFDIVLCRYVLIYFDEAARRKTLESLASCLKPGGFVVLGAGEMLGNYGCGLERRRLGDSWVYG